MPEDSAFVAKVRGGPEHRIWTTTTHLSAGIFNLLMNANYQRAGKRTPQSAFISPPESATSSARKAKRLSLRDFRKQGVQEAVAMAQKQQLEETNE